MNPQHNQRESERGYLVDTFRREYNGRTVIYGVARMDNGETAGIVERRRLPTFFVRESDEPAVRRQVGTAKDVRVGAYDRKTMDGEQLSAVTAASFRKLRRFSEVLEKKGIRTYEADILPERAMLMDLGVRRSITVSGAMQKGRRVDHVYINPTIGTSEIEPDLCVLALDIETRTDTEEVYAVSLVAWHTKSKVRSEEILAVWEPKPGDPAELVCCPDEISMLRAVLKRVRKLDPDVITGWNVIDFDLQTLAGRCRKYAVKLNIGRTDAESRYFEGRKWGWSKMIVEGRQVLDAMHLARRHSRKRLDNWRLDTVARALLNRGKTLSAEKPEDMPRLIEQTYRSNRGKFCNYCLEDSRLVEEILESKDLLELTLGRSLITGLSLERAWGSIAAFDFLYITELHKQGKAAPTAGVDQADEHGSPGGMVFIPKAGLYHDIQVFDFKSLYPSIIRTFNIDPLAYLEAQRDRTEQSVITAPNQAEFSRRTGILPRILTGLFQRRDAAKVAHKDSASYVLKILMNSFYGVLGTRGCRFADRKLAGAITGLGQEILKWSKDFLHSTGREVLYGDTDSLFVKSKFSAEIEPDELHARGAKLCEEVNRALAEYVKKNYGVDSRLELEFEKHYKRLLLPPMRGHAKRGRAKGYAGMLLSPQGQREIEIIGMEAVRRDWTKMAQEFQRELLERVFRDTPSVETEDFARCWIRDLRDGKKDKTLIYRKRLRKAVSEYTKTTPPHVKAAKLLENPGGTIRYIMTTKGPQPESCISAPVDYQHYIEKQIKPILKTIAKVCSLDAEGILTGEQNLFSMNMDEPPGDSIGDGR